MQVNITKRIDTPEGKRYCSVAVDPNGRIKPDWVMANDRQEKHPDGAYYLDWNEDGKRRRISVGTDAAAADNSRVRKQRELDAVAAGLIVSNPIEDDSRLRIRSAVDDFLEEIQPTRQRKTWRGYRVSLGYFQESCDKCFLEEIDWKDLLRFAAFLRDTKKLAPRTVHSKFADVLALLQAQGMPKLIGKNDHPRFIEQEVDIYEDDELSSLHAVCLPYHSTLYDFFFMSGLRKQEGIIPRWMVMPRRRRGEGPLALFIFADDARTSVCKVQTSGRGARRQLFPCRWSMARRIVVQEKLERLS